MIKVITEDVNRILEDINNRMNQKTEKKSRKVVEILEDGAEMICNEIRENRIQMHEVKEEIIGTPKEFGERISRKLMEQIKETMKQKDPKKECQEITRAIKEIESQGIASKFQKIRNQGLAMREELQNEWNDEKEKRSIRNIRKKLTKQRKK
jgi:hypothetical protein